MEFSTYQFTGVWAEVLGTPERNGAWLIWGQEKNGKTTLALMLANEASKIEQTVFVSGEEGIGKNFREACKRAGIDAKSKLKVIPYMPLLELDEWLSRKRAPKIVFIDNVTHYSDELKYGAFLRMVRKHDDKIFVYLAHEEQGEPYTSSGKLIKRYAKVIIHVEGLKGFVSGRCPGGSVVIDEEKAMLYHGDGRE